MLRREMDADVRGCPLFPLEIIQTNPCSDSFCGAEPRRGCWTATNIIALKLLCRSGRRKPFKKKSPVKSYWEYWGFFCLDNSFSPNNLSGVVSHKTRIFICFLDKRTKIFPRAKQTFMDQLLRIQRFTDWDLRLSLIKGREPYKCQSYGN